MKSDYVYLTPEIADALQSIPMELEYSYRGGNFKPCRSASLDYIRARVKHSGVYEYRFPKDIRTTLIELRDEHDALRSGIKEKDKVIASLERQLEVLTETIENNEQYITNLRGFLGDEQRLTTKLSKTIVSQAIEITNLKEKSNES